MLRFARLVVNVGTESIGSKLAGKSLSKELSDTDRQDCSPPARLGTKGLSHAADGHIMKKLLRGGDTRWN
ncbi:MAG: hypothetical protein OK456_03360 [Thaumarchaeota archaeon]|nr:hypothetical protein [Nitrososphaerota archaeon]